jgi:hypothetical protein
MRPLRLATSSVSDHMTMNRWKFDSSSLFPQKVMDAFDDSAISLEETTLSYENDVPYEAQIPMDPPRSSLANRIGKGKVYLLSETARARVGKVRSQVIEGDGSDA